MSASPSPLIDAGTLMDLQAQGAQPLLLDCSFDLADPGAGERAFAAGHLPGAQYAHLDRDLSGPKTARGSIDGGRHPLPSRAAMAVRMGQWGIRPGTPVVVYDAQGASYAARAWWLLHWLGHSAVQVLDGGLQAWQAAGGALVSAAASYHKPTSPYPVGEPGMAILDAPQLLANLGNVRVLDARAPERFRGEVEPLDATAGHIPGARNRFFKLNLAADGRFRAPAELRAEFLALGVPPEQLVHQCGSGVTACHNLLAMEIAGMPGARLYPGSWSEWSADPGRPVARA